MTVRSPIMCVDFGVLGEPIRTSYLGVKLTELDSESWAGGRDERAWHLAMRKP